MNRRNFLWSGLLGGLGLMAGAKASAQASVDQDHSGVCVIKVDEIYTEATGYRLFEHYHQLAIPVSALIAPPNSGLQVRTTMIDQYSYDPKGGEQLKGFTQHSHLVSFTPEQLDRIATGEKDVKISVLSPMGFPAHDFFFTAPNSALIKVKRGRAQKKV